MDETTRADPHALPSDAIREPPRSLGQAARISGVTPVAVSILMAHLALTNRRRADVSSAS